MSKIGHLKSIAAKKPGVARTAIACMLLMFVFGCGDADTPPVYSGPGTGGSTGSGGASGPGGTAGMGGISGSGGMTGTGASSGTGGMVGTGGSGGGAGPCVADVPPDSFLCDTDDDCNFSGWVCIDSGCKGDGGAPIKQCVPSWARSCSSGSDCPNGIDYQCTTVAPGGKRCVRVTDGCDPAYETYDCAPGFSCEGPSGEEACVDRRVPCDSYQDCPKSHICLTVSEGNDPIAKYCARVSRTCHIAEDCSWLGNSFGSFCDDVDGDGTDECTGQRGATGEACVNADCGGLVCETGAVGSASSCASYGLCRFDNECDAGFECLDLWQDGRKECVPTGGTCSQVTDCLLPNQVCAAPRSGGPPSCQSGSAP